MTDATLRPLALLLVDDEPIVLHSLADWFRHEGHQVETAANGKEALRRVVEREFDLAFVDIKMPGMDGLELQKRLTEAQPGLTIVVMTAYASVESAVEALKSGAYDYITKPFDPEELSLLVRRAGEHRSLVSENQRLKERLDVVGSPEPIVGSSPGMRRVLELVQAVGASEATVLIKGESGTGKELVARAIHARSPRRYGPLVVVNCGALADGVLESELFGHEKGAFTGAQHRHKGRFELADGGTIFLDEIATIGPRVQVDLLRVLEEKTVTRVGAQKPVPVDFRVIAATNRDLEELIARGEFREDLFWRLNVFTIEIPALRERPEDIELLATHFLGRFAQAMNRPSLRLSPEALTALVSYPWPGNVRELQNAIERAVVIGSPPQLEVSDLPLRVTGQEAGKPGALSLHEVERAHIQALLERTQWNVSKTARLLEVDRGTLYNKIERYGLRRPADAG